MLIRVECVFVAVHIGGGLWGIFAVPIFRRTVGPNINGGFVEDVFNSIIYRISAGESWRVKNKSCFFIDDLSSENFLIQGST